MAEVEAQMVGKVWKIVANEGDCVEEGDPIIILESMKMEIPIEAEVDGKVTKINVVFDQVVNEGDIVAEIEEDDC